MGLIAMDQPQVQSAPMLHPHSEGGVRQPRQIPIVPTLKIQSCNFRPNRTPWGMARWTVHEHCQRFRVRLALKVAVGATVCACVSNLFHLKSGYLSSLFVALVLVVFHGKTLGAGVPAFLGVLIAGSVEVLLSAALHDTGAAYLFCSLLWLFLWMAFLRTLPLAHMLGGILIAMVLFNHSLGTAEVRTLVQSFWLQNFLGVFLAIGLDRLIWATKVEDTYFEALAGLLESFANDIDALVIAADGESRDHSPDATQLRHIAHLANFSTGRPGSDEREKIRLNISCRLIWERIRLARRFLVENRQDVLTPDQRREFDAAFRGLANHYRTIAEAALHSRRAPDVDPETRRVIGELTRKLRCAEADLTTVDTSAPVVRLIEHGLANHEHVVDSYNALLDAPERRQHRPPDVGAIFANILAWPPPAAFKTAARIALIVFTLFVGVIYLHFPGSALVAFYGVAFGLTANLGQLYMKGRSGTLGILGGISLGIVGVLIAMQSPHFPVVMALFAIAMFLAAYASTAPEPIGFAGLQAALVTPYMFVYYEGPQWTTENAITRACALVVSAAVAMIVQRLFWPVDPLVLFRNVASRALETIAAAWERLRRNERRMPKKSTLADALDQSASLLQDSRYVVGSRHPLAHAYLQLLRSLQDMFASMQALAQLLAIEKDDASILEAYERISPDLGAVTQTLESLSCRIAGQENSESEDQPTRLAALHKAVTRLRKAPPPGIPLESRRKITVMGSLLCEIADSLFSAVSAAREIPTATPAPMIGSSEGWQSSATANPAH